MLLRFEDGTSTKTLFGHCGTFYPSCGWEVPLRALFRNTYTIQSTVEVSCFCDCALPVSCINFFQPFVPLRWLLEQCFLPKPSCCDQSLALLRVIVSTPDHLHGALLLHSPLSPVLNSPGSTLARWLHFAKHSCLPCERETTTVQLQRNVFFGLSPLAVPLWQEGRAWKVEERGGRGNVFLYCRLLRHHAGKDEITPAALPFGAKPQHLCCLRHRATLRCKERRRKAFLVSFPVFFLILKSTPEWSFGSCTFLNSHAACLTRVGSCENTTPRESHWDQNSLLRLLSPPPHFLGGLVSSASPSLFPQCCKQWVTLAGTCDPAPLREDAQEEGNSAGQGNSGILTSAEGCCQSPTVIVQSTIIIKYF